MTRSKKRSTKADRDWITCTCDAPVSYGLFMRCPTCDFMFHDALRRRPARPRRLSGDIAVGL